MSFNTNAPRLEYVATAGQTEFTFNFKAYETSDVDVYLTPNGQLADETNDVLVETTDYSVAIDGDNGGTVTLVVAATAGDKVTLIRDLPYTRITDYQYGGDLRAEVLDNDQNRQTYLAQQLEASKQIFIRLPLNLQSVSATLPAPVPSSYFRWSADGLSIENDTTIPTNVQQAIDSAAAAVAAQAAAEAAAAAAAASEDDFDDTYLGPKASDPTTDNDGDPLNAGDLYFNTTDSSMKVYDGAAWNSASVVAYTKAESDVKHRSVPMKVKATEAITKGDVIMATGYNQGEDAIEVAKTVNQTDIAVGIASTDIANGAFGDVFTRGLIEGLDTSLFSFGDILYSSGAGGYTNVQPTGAYQAMGFVVKNHASNGALMVDFTEPSVTVTNTANTFTASQRGTVTADNDLSFDMNVTNNFKCTPTGNGVLTFTNITAGQSGNIWLDNSGGHAISAAATVFLSANDLANINTAGIYFLSYYSDGANVQVSATQATTSAGV